MTRRQNERDTPDFYVACYADVDGWGGGVTLARHITAQLTARGASLRMLGVIRKLGAQSAPVADCTSDNVELPASAHWTWRIQSWRAPSQLADALRQLPQPRKAFISVSPFWCVAGRRAWPETRNFYVFPCLLANCLPFARSAERGATFWQRVDFAGVACCERRALKIADGVLAPTNAALDEIATFEPAARSKTERCDFGCQPVAISSEARSRVRRDLGLSDDSFVVLAAGVFDRNKAFELLISELRRADKSVFAIVAGAGPELPALTSLARSVPGRVRFVTPGRDLMPFLSAADACVSTSHYDTFPNVLLEALSAGRPVIAPRHNPPQVYAGIAELLAEDGGGLLYPRETPGALATAMNELARQPALCRELSQQALRLAARRLSNSELADAVMAHCGRSSDVECLPSRVKPEKVTCDA